MNKLVNIYKDEIRLNSFLTENAYGKTNYEQVLSQSGIFFDGKNFKSWTFDDIKAFDMEGLPDRYVHYIGKNPLSESAFTLLDAFENVKDEEAKKAGFLVCKVLTEAAKNNIDLPVNGAGGIIVDIKNDSEAVLFLPGNLYKYAASALKPEEYAEYHGSWINPTLSGIPALCFERALIVYRLIAGKLPFEETDVTKRNADILDGKFIPVELEAAHPGNKLAFADLKGLFLNANIIAEPGKKHHGVSSDELKPDVDFPLEELKDYLDGKHEETEEIRNKRILKKRDFEKKVYSKIEIKRFFRRNTAKIATAAGVLVILGFLVGNYIVTRQKELCSLGLSSVQTVEAFLTGVNNKDTSLLDNIASGKTVNGYIDTVSQIYVIGRQRQQYSKIGDFSSLANWFFQVDGPESAKNAGLYSICGVKIDGKDDDLDVEIYSKKQKPEAVTEEGGIILKKGSQSVHKAEYYLAYTEGENSDITLKYVKNIFILTYKNKRWIITAMETSEEELPFDSDGFKNAYYERLKANNHDVVKSVKQLSLSYSWLPSEKMMEKEKIKVEEEIKDISLGL